MSAVPASVWGPSPPRSPREAPWTLTTHDRSASWIVRQEWVPATDRSARGSWVSTVRCERHDGQPVSVESIAQTAGLDVLTVRAALRHGCALAAQARLEQPRIRPRRALPPGRVRVVAAIVIEGTVVPC